MGMLGERLRHEGGGREMTKQSDALASDVNAIVKRHVQSGVPLPTGPVRYGDFTGSLSAFEAMTRVMELEQQFSRLPAQIRKLCENDPVRFLELSESPEGQEQLKAAGLVKELEVAKPVVADVESAGEGPEKA